MLAAKQLSAGEYGVLLSPIPLDSVPSLQKKGCSCSIVENVNKNVLFTYNSESALAYIKNKLVKLEHYERVNNKGSFTNKYKSNGISVISKSREIDINETCESYHESINHKSCFSSNVSVLNNARVVQQFNGFAICGC